MKRFHSLLMSNRRFAGALLLVVAIAIGHSPLLGQDVPAKDVLLKDDFETGFVKAGWLEKR